MQRRAASRTRDDEVTGLAVHAVQHRHQVLAPLQGEGNVHFGAIAQHFEPQAVAHVLGGHHEAVVQTLVAAKLRHLDLFLGRLAEITNRLHILRAIKYMRPTICHTEFIL